MSGDLFGARTRDDLSRLVLDHPLAWVVCAGGPSPLATLLPMRSVPGEGGAPCELVGHFARSNPQVEALRRAPRALILFLGPHGYVSPSWMADRTQAPTWNYASAQFVAEVEFVEGPEATQGLLRDLTGGQEAGRPAPWSIEDMGVRYRRLARRVAGFRARVIETRPGFKLGQDESPGVFADILAGLERGGGSDLARWMRRFREDR